MLFLSKFDFNNTDLAYSTKFSLSHIVVSNNRNFTLNMSLQVQIKASITHFSFLLNKNHIYSNSNTSSDMIFVKQ